MIATPRRWTCLHLFAGIGGCTLGFKRAGLRSLGSIDFDAKAIEQLRRMTGGSPAFVRDIASLQPADLRQIVPESPDVVVMSPPCKSFSGCMPAARAAEEHYVDMSQLAVRGTFLALEAWERLPGYVLIENVPRIRTRGAPLLEQIIALLHRYGFATDQRVHDCGEIGGLAQHRDRFLLMARNMERCPAFLRRPPAKRVRNVGEVLLPLPSPAADHGDPMHRLPLLSPMNWLRLAAIPAGKDWRALPAEIRIGGERRGGAYEVLDPAEPGKVVRGRHDVWAAPASVADERLDDAEVDPRVAWSSTKHGGRPDSFGVGSMGAPSLVVRGRQEVQTSRASIADTRLAESNRRFKGKMQVSAMDQPSNTITGTSATPALGACAVVADTRLGTNRKGRQNGGFGVEDCDAPAHSVLGRSTINVARASVADTRLGCSQRSGSYGVQDAVQPGATIVGHHSHDNSPGSMADPRLSYRTAERVAAADSRAAGAGFSGRGDFGVLDPAAPAPAIRARHEVRQAPAAVVDERGWPVPTHELVRDADGGLTLYGPAIDLKSKRACYMVIRAPDGCWHRPLTLREKATLQSVPTDFVIEGPASSSKKQAGVGEWIGNMIPVDTAEGIGLELIEALESSVAAGFLRGADVWVERATGLSAAAGDA